MLGLILIIVVLVFALFYTLLNSEKQINFRVDEFRKTELAAYKAKCDVDFQYLKDQACRIALEDAQVKLNQWKKENEELLRQDAIK